MPHLSTEALARLLDEEPTATERRHLEGCAICGAELEALRADRLALGELPHLLPPPAGAWDALAERLHDEGLISTSPARALRPGPRILRIAAALALFLSGVATGFMARGAGDSSTGELAQGVEAEAAYQAALAQYAELAAEEPYTDPIARLAALENIVITTRDALAAAPADPLINGYHMAALAQRDATVRQIALTDNDRWY